ncbi:MAG: hypothetical protein IKH81_01510 [Clostridia bacterium]|nr:hypothetical protein [Clostridia bacterium]
MIDLLKLLKQHAAVKSIGGIVLLLLVFFATVSLIGYNSFTEALLSQYSEGAFLTAETAARRLDADRMEEYAQSGGTTPEYLEAWNEMDELCNSTARRSSMSFSRIEAITPTLPSSFPRLTTTADIPNTISDMYAIRPTTNTGRNTARCMNWKRIVNC